MNISAIGPRFGSPKLAAASARALILAVFAALLLIAAHPAQAQTETVLYNFTGGSDGSTPESRLTSDSAGNFYGTTLYGGLGYGTVFELSPNGIGGWNESVLYSFTGGADGEYPQHSSVLFDSAGNLYGTTAAGGGRGAGVVFELSPVGSSWAETTLYTFCIQANCADGANPRGGLTMDSAGNLYGTYGGGMFTGKYGGIFELSPSGSSWTEKVIYSSSSSNLTVPGVTMDAKGDIFGTIASKAVKLSPNGAGGWNSTVIYAFTGNPKEVDTPTLDKAGNFYAMTSSGGAYHCGSVYQVKLGNTGKWTEKILHSFPCPNQFGWNHDGYAPRGNLAFDSAGNIYGTTSGGGTFGTSGAGTIFELVAPVGKGSYTEKVLWSFNLTDGGNPNDGLILSSAGNLYGTTYAGGSSGYGVVFEVTGLPAATTTTLTSSPNPSTYGQAVTFTAVVTSSIGAPPDGETVSFMKGTTVLGTGTSSGGSASFTTSTLKVGTTSVTALYVGDSNFSGSTSNTVKQVVEKAGK